MDWKEYGDLLCSLKKNVWSVSEISVQLLITNIAPAVDVLKFSIPLNFLWCVAWMCHVLYDQWHELIQQHTCWFTHTCWNTICGFLGSHFQFLNVLQAFLWLPWVPEGYISYHIQSMCSVQVALVFLLLKITWHQVLKSLSVEGVLLHSI